MQQVELPLLYGNYTWANGKCVEKPDATIVAIHTNVTGVIGYPKSPNPSTLHRVLTS